MRPAPNDLVARADDVRSLVATFRLDEAIKRLLDFAKDFDSKDHVHEDDAITISAEYHHLTDLELESNETATISSQRLQLMRRLLARVRKIEASPPAAVALST